MLVAAARLANRLDRLSASLEEQIKPLFSHLDAIGQEASRATQLASAQVERVDALFGDVAVRVGQAMDGVQGLMTAPAREGAALMAGLRAAMTSLRQGARTSGRPRGRGEDEDALFI